MKNLPITWRLNIGLAIFASLGLGGGFLTWWIGKEHEAARLAASQQEAAELRAANQILEQQLRSERATRRYILSENPISAEEFKQQQEVIWRRADSEIDSLQRILQPQRAAIRKMEDQIAALRQTNGVEAVQLYAGDYQTGHAKLTREINLTVSTRPLGETNSRGIYLLQVLLVVVMAVFVAWTIGMLRHNVVAFKEPVAELRSVLDRVGKGDFTIDVHLKRKDEFADLANGIIAMTRNLALMIDRLHQNANAVEQASKTILSASGHQQKAVDQIEHVTEFLAEASRKIHFSAAQLANTISVVGQASDVASRLGETGTTGLEELGTAMKVISDSSEAINSKLENLNEKAGAVSRVVSTMSKVADQTNLLSINAAIEAEKAGESGKGFAVVASEIQRLADRTAQDADEVEQLVKEMQKAVAAGVIGTEQFDNDVRAGTEGLSQLTSTVEGIARQIESIKPQVEIITNSMHTQAEGARQLQARSNSLDEAMKDSAESSHEMRAAVQQLESAAQELEDGKSRFNFIN